MNLWWLYTRHDTCGFSEIEQRSCIPFSWSEIGNIGKYVKDKPNWERQFKTYVQIKGDLAYSNDANWQLENRDFDRVPELFWKFLHIKAGDIIVCIESGSQKTLGKPVERGIGLVTQDGFASYDYKDQFSYAHSVCKNTRWFSLEHWSKSLALEMPKQSFFILSQDNSQMALAQDIIDEMTSENYQQYG